MKMPERLDVGAGAADLAIDTAQKDTGGRLTAAVSAIALLFSGYSLYDSSLKAPSLQVFVPPVIQYSSPYQNNNFEVFAVPVTILNDGGRTGTVLSMELEVSKAGSTETKRFYAADLGRWTMEKARAYAFDPFAPIALSGKDSRTMTVLFYPTTPTEKPEQLATEPGRFNFRLILDEAKPEGWFDKWTRAKPVEANFQMELRYFDARAFQNGTLPMYSTTGNATNSADGAPPP